MSTFRSDLLTVLEQRGFIHQMTDAEALDALLASASVSAYIGFDCTADSLHIGNLVGIMMLRHLQDCGHRPLALVGGGTSKVGDPSGKDDARQLLDAATLAHNLEGVQRSLASFLDFSGGRTLLANNADWLDELSYLPFLRDIGRHFTINRMLTFDSVRLRLDREQPLTFLEFNYMILQAYDFVELAKRFDCRLQLGGSDQWGNIVNGVELGRRRGTKELFGLTTPLITTSSGQKMGKSVKGAVWLNEDRLPVYDYWQFWRNTEDGDVGHFLRLFTLLPLDEIVRLEALAGTEINDAKKILATEATALCHGRTAAETARDTAQGVFEARNDDSGLPQINLSGARLDDGLSILDLFLEAGLTASKAEARRLIRGGGAKLNDTKIEDETLSVTRTGLREDGSLKLSAGKKRHLLVRII